MTFIKGVPITLGFVVSQVALLALMAGPSPWIRPLVQLASIPAYVLTVPVAGLGLGLAWPWNTALVLAVMMAIDGGIAGVGAWYMGGRQPRGAV